MQDDEARSLHSEQAEASQRRAQVRWKVSNSTLIELPHAREVLDAGDINCLSGDARRAIGKGTEYITVPIATFSTMLDMLRERSR